MSMPEYLGAGKRKKVTIDEENYYILLDDTHLDITLPYENRKDNEKQRVLINYLCKEISKLMKLRDSEKRHRAADEISTVESGGGRELNYTTAALCNRSITSVK